MPTAETGESHTQNKKARFVQMIGIIESVLTRRYGPPRIADDGPYTERRWLEGSERSTSVLYQAPNLLWDATTSGDLDVLKPIYGDALGGFLLGGSLKAATRGSHEFYGLYTIATLQEQMKLYLTERFEPGISFFMDAANVWFYGVKREVLWCYDSTFDELYEVADVATALDELLKSWEETKQR